MDRSLNKLAELFGGVIKGDPERRILGVSSLEAAGPDDLAPLLEGRYLARVEGSRAGVLLTDESLARRVVRRTLWIHPSPRLALARLLEYLSPPTEEIVGGIHPSAVVDGQAVVHPTARVEALAFVGTRAVIGPRTLIGVRAVVAGEVTIGEDCQLGPGAMVLDRCCLGHRVRLGPGAIVGADGFGFLPTGNLPTRMPQLGRVVIEDDVELGALTVVDRGTLGDTRVRRGAKLDNLVQVGHNVEMGPGVIVAAQAGFAGSVKVGARALIGGQAGVADHLVVGEDARVAAKSGIVGDVAPRTTVAGYPAMERSTWLRLWATLRRRPNRS